MYVSITYTLYVCLVVQFSRVGLAISMYASNKESDGQGGEGGGGTGADEQSFSRIRQSDLYPHSSKVVGKHSRTNCPSIKNDDDYLCCGNGRSSGAALNYLCKRGANWQHQSSTQTWYLGKGVEVSPVP